MARIRNRNKPPIPTVLRVRMHRERAKAKLMRQKLIDNTIPRETNNTESSTSSTPSLSDDLRDWANSNRISMRAIDQLLRILKSNGINSVPLNHRTLLHTPINIEIVPTAGGSLWYNGFEKCIKRIFNGIDRDWTISLNINVDGLPIYDSSNVTFWPILASIYGMCC